MTAVNQPVCALANAPRVLMQPTRSSFGNAVVTDVPVAAVPLFPTPLFQMSGMNPRSAEYSTATPDITVALPVVTVITFVAPVVTGITNKFTMLGAASTIVGILNGL